MSATKKLNGVDTVALQETCEYIKANPKIARCEFRASNQWIDGGHNQVSIQGYYAAGEEQKTRRNPFVFDADEPPALQGSDKGANPVEYVLAALSSCMTTSIIYHTSLKGYKINSLSSDFKGDLDLQGFLGIKPSIPKGYQKIYATFKISTDAPESVIEEGYKFSPVYEMLSKSVPININIQFT